MKTICLLLSACLLTLQATAQKTIMTESGPVVKEKKVETPCVKPRDSFYDRTLCKEKMPLPYDHIHERDVMWEKKIWRELDVRQKKNHTFTYAKRPFISILLEAAEAGNATLYSTWDDEFSEALSQKDIENTVSSYDTTIIYDPETYEEKVVVVKNEFNPADVIGYKLKEVWFFDSETASLGVRILGIAPIVNKYDDDGRVLHSAPMFWAYYPELRSVLAKEETFNPMNDGARLSWDDLFEARLFASHITKENNVHDKRIKDYIAGGEKQLLEGEKIEETIRNYELDMWSH